MPRVTDVSKKEPETKPVCEVKPEKPEDPAKEWPWSTGREMRDKGYDESFVSEADLDQDGRDDQVESMDISLNSTLKGKIVKKLVKTKIESNMFALQGMLRTYLDLRPRTEVTQCLRLSPTSRAPLTRCWTTRWTLTSPK